MPFFGICSVKDEGGFEQRARGVSCGRGECLPREYGEYRAPAHKSGGWNAKESLSAGALSPRTFSWSRTGRHLGRFSPWAKTMHGRGNTESSLCASPRRSVSHQAAANTADRGTKVSFGLLRQSPQYAPQRQQPPAFCKQCPSQQWFARIVYCSLPYPKKKSFAARHATPKGK
jgi:hypothetical protein